MIELSEVSKSFGGIPALIDINLFIQEGEIFGIIGKSGAGKSTLLRCINLLEKPDTGEVSLDGEYITHYSNARLRDIRHKTAMIFQQFNLIQAKNVYENIALPLRIQQVPEEIIDQRVRELLNLVELSDKATAWPAKLSGGQKQRVAIARALASNPKILLCDEATSALDPETTESILALLKKIQELFGITIVLITHEMEVVKRICHRLAYMEDGRIVETTALADVFKNPDSPARNLLYKQLTPELPAYLLNKLTNIPTDKPVLSLFFHGEEATVPFISRTSRELSLDINILLANMDQYDTLTCGALIIELTASPLLLQDFLARCKEAKLTVEIVGYVLEHAI